MHVLETVLGTLTAFYRFSEHVHDILSQTYLAAFRYRAIGNLERYRMIERVDSSLQHLVCNLGNVADV